MKRSLALVLIAAFALVAGCYHCYKEYVRPGQLEDQAWNKYSASGKWLDQLIDTQATTIIGDSHIIELDFGQLDRQPVHGIAYRGATSLLLQNLGDSMAHLQPQLTITMIGTNDVLFGIDAAVSASRWEHYISMLKQQQGSGIFAINIPPMHVEGGLFTSPSKIEHRISDYNKMLDRHATQWGIEIIDLHEKLSSLGDPASYFERDGIHLNDRGYEVLVSLINDELKD